MPGPPPPPPAAPPPPLPKFTAPSRGGGGGDPRDALLKSIHKGAKLKKVATNDRSAPIVGKVSNNNNPSSTGVSSGLQNNSNSSHSPKPNGMVGLGGLFADGIPKLRPTGKLGVPLETGGGIQKQHKPINRQNSSPMNAPIKNVENIQNKIKKQLANNDNRNRGPPPPAPTRNYSDEGRTFPAKNGMHQNHVNSTSNLPGLIANKTSLHQSKSNTNLSSQDYTDSGFNGVHSHLRPVINHGKPNLAPKPPSSTGTLPNKPKKLAINGKTVNRAHSMRSPRSPSPQSPEANPLKSVSVKDISQQLGGSSISLSGGRTRPFNGRPNAPPPSIPHIHNSHSPSHMYPAPPKNTVKPPNHAPPPPPSAIPQVPNHAPPAPPHRTLTRPPPAIPSHSAPPPPPRLSSMSRGGVDVEDRFRNMFKPPESFPPPPPFKKVLKLYSNKQAVSKQQAPQPPSFQQRSWNSTSAC